jgi:YegS/Rv2252/BmrU family lipid kinase
MSERKSIVIINPVAGTRNRKLSGEQIRSWLDANHLKCDIAITQYRGHGYILTNEAMGAGYNHFVVVGGDGTLNEVASALIGKPGISLGIVPRGSGNGLARHLKLPAKPQTALNVAFGEKTLAIDVGFLNDRPFFSVAGIGFDAEVAHTFAGMKGRGLKNYIRAVLKNFPGYRPAEYHIGFPDQKITIKALMITFANSNQFGNNTSLSPQARLNDGLIDICMVKKPNIASALIVSPLLFLKKLDRTKFLRIIRSPEAVIELTLPSWGHIDGDPFPLDTSIAALKTMPGALHIHIK